LAGGYRGEVATVSERSRSFGSVAADYDRLRSQPAEAAVDWLVPERPDLLVDVGAGTGIFSRALAARAGHVVAVEPDGRMRAVLKDRSPDAEVLAGRGEAIPLPDASADGVFASSSWHWMDPEKALPEIARVLRDGGRFGVIGTGREPTDWLRPNEWFREAAFGDGDVLVGETVAGGNARGVRLPRSGLFTNIETQTFRFIRTMTPSDLVEWLLTYSGVITAAPEIRERGRRRAAAALARQFPGASQIEVPMRSRCWRADRVPRPAD
jgi:SAM-dependent methyltransferase